MSLVGRGRLSLVDIVFGPGGILSTSFPAGKFINELDDLGRRIIQGMDRQACQGYSFTY